MTLYNTSFSMMWPTVTPKSLLPSDVLWFRANIKNSGYPPGSRASLTLTDCLPQTCIPVIVSYLKTVTALAANPKKESRLVSPCSRRVWSVTRQRTASISSSRLLPQKEKSLRRRVQTPGCLENDAGKVESSS